MPLKPLPMKPHQIWIKDAEVILAGFANPKKAPAMAAYMKQLFPFYGIQQPGRKQAFSEIKNTLGYPDFSEAQTLLPALMDQPEREWHLLAIDIAINQKFPLQPNALPLLTTCFLKKSWWDTVDPMAVHWFGKFLLKFPERIPECVSTWSASDNIWLQRLSVLYCLKYKEKTDFILLRQTMEKLAGSKEFFVQKGIGWVLREKSKTHPDWVRETLAEISFKPLSVREGSKYLPPAVPKH
jgi:3-methyladenine DNA glycosylase AlkD